MSSKGIANAMGDKVTQQARLMLQNCPDPRVRELIATGISMSPAGAGTQTIIQMAAPILAEMGIDFAISNMHNTEDPDAMKEAHKWAREVVGHAIKIGVIDKLSEADMQQREREMQAFEKLLEVTEAANKSGMRLDQALGVVIEAEVEED